MTREHDLAEIKIILQDIERMGWVSNKRPGNPGGVGNTLEDLLKIEENNLQLPDFGHWEVKSQRDTTGSLLTLFHMEPHPRKARIVPQILLPKYGWAHQKAGIDYPLSERSFRLTITATSDNDRGFKVAVCRQTSKIYVSFDYNRVAPCYNGWQLEVKRLAGTSDIAPNPYWDFSDIAKKLNTKLPNLLYFRAQHKIDNGIEYFKYEDLTAFINPTVERFIQLIENGSIFVDFDARTGHNHGTKFRIKPGELNALYEGQIATQ